MPEARMGRDPRSDERVGMRQGIKPGTQVRIDLIREQFDVELLEVSLEGCAIACPPSLDPQATEVQVHFEGVLREGPVTRPRRGRICNREVGPDGRLRCGVQFDPALSQAVYSRFDQVVTGPLRDTRTRAKQFENQKQLALLDLAASKATARGIHLMQLQLLLLGVPILLAFLGPAFTYLLSVDDAPMPWWMLVLPLASLLFAFVLLGGHLRLAASENRQGAFAVLIERGLAEACFPPGYRGWEDAAGHLHQIERRGLAPDSCFRVPADADPLALRPSQTPGTELLKAASGIYLGIALIAVLMMWLVAAKLGLGMTRHTIFVAGSTALLGVLAIESVALARRAIAGDRSFNLYYQRLNAVLAHAGYFDPER